VRNCAFEGKKAFRVNQETSECNTGEMEITTGDIQRHRRRDQRCADQQPSAALARTADSVVKSIRFLTFKKQNYAVLKKPPARSPTVSADITVFLCGIAHLRAKMAFCGFRHGWLRCHPRNRPVQGQAGTAGCKHSPFPAFTTFLNFCLDRNNGKSILTPWN
jgi:hypothetical protein